MHVSALDETGKPVDWWFMYKVPKLGAGANSDAATGYEYCYYDAAIDAAGGAVAKSPYTIDGGKGALNRTLASVFAKPSPTTGWILYNDEKPEGAAGTDDGNLGHTKGVIAFDTGSGTAYWLLHSWPKFAAPAAPKDPTPEYGQTYLCLSLDIATARAIAAQMAEHQEPQTYLCRPAKLARTDPLFALTLPLNANPAGDSNVLDAKTAAGMPFKVIAKNRQWDRDFWNDLVGPTLKADLDVESWIRGPIPPIADSDGIHKTFDIKFVNLSALGANWAWPESHDHAKWGVTRQSDWVCVGDINRMISQRKRGGGTIAFRNATLWKALSKTGLLLAPPGHTRDTAHALVRTTHAAPTHPRAPGRKATKATKAAKTAKTAKRRA